MNLYYIERLGMAHYDEWEDAVVAANTEEEAHMIHPDGMPWAHERISETWVRSEKVQVEYIGTTDKYKAGEVICAAFNAG